MMDSLMLNYANTLGVAIHLGDPMSEPAGTAVGDVYTGGGVPAFLLDRYLFEDYGFVSIGTNYDLLTEKIEARLAEPARVGMSFETVALDTATNLLSVTLQATFFDDVDDFDDLRFNLYVVEDEVEPTTPNMVQQSFFNFVEGHAFYGMGGNLEDYAHRYVVRHMAGGAWGKANSLPQVAYKQGDSFNYIFLVEIDDSWNRDALSLVGLVQHADETSAGNRQILNSEEITLATALTAADGPEPEPEDSIATSVVPLLVDDLKLVLNAYPNPVRQSANIEIRLPATAPTTIEVLDLRGAVVDTIRAEMMSSGLHTVEWQVPTNCAAGAYLVRVQNGAFQHSKRVLVVR